VVAVAGLSLARQNGAGALDTIYAEDGSVFLGSAYAESTLDSITTPYAGYLHLVPRVLSELVSALPVSWAAAGLAIAAALTTGLLALLVYACTRDYLAPWGRVLSAAVVVLVPVGQDELPNSIANLHWPMLYALFWVLLAKRLNTWLAASAVLLISLSDPLVVLFVPLAVWLWWRRRSAQSLAVTVALGAGLAAQAAAVFFGPSGRQLHPEPVRWAPWYVVRAVPESVLGQRWFGNVVNTRWLALAAVAWLFLAFALFLAWRAAARSASAAMATVRDAMPSPDAGASRLLAPQPGRWPAPDGWRLAALAGGYSVAVYALPVGLSGQATPRYAAASAMLLVTAIAALFFPPETATAPMTVAAAAILAFCVVVWAVNLRVPNERGNGPLWSDELAKSCGASTTAADVPITPPGWKVPVPCGG
jgi:hypothetical protein